jgi:RecG-like helicase
MSRDIEKIITKARSNSLQKAGISTIYELITFFPRKITTLEPITSLEGAGIMPGNEYFSNGTLLSLDERRGRQPYYILRFQTEYGIISGFYFVTGRYVYSQLKPNLEYQFIVIRSNNSWTFKKISQLSTINSGHDFRLGNADINSKYLVPVYPKRDNLTSAYFVATHSNIPQQVYKLDLEGLVPRDTIIPTMINLYDIHHPTTVQKYTDCLQQWAILKVFLKLSVIKYINIETTSTLTTAGKLDVEYLKSLSDNLPYTLSNSQKTTIWDILNDITIT